MAYLKDLTCLNRFGIIATELTLRRRQMRRLNLGQVLGVCPETRALHLVEIPDPLDIPLAVTRLKAKPARSKKAGKGK